MVVDQRIVTLLIADPLRRMQDRREEQLYRQETTVSFDDREHTNKAVLAVLARTWRDDEGRICRRREGSAAPHRQLQLERHAVKGKVA